MAPRHPTRHRRGMVAVQAAFAMMMLTGMAALAIDGGLLLAERRHARAVADAAAMAGAVDLFKNWPTKAGSDSGGTAAASARTTALANYTSDPSNVSVDVYIPPIGSIKNVNDNTP